MIKFYTTISIKEKEEEEAKESTQEFDSLHDAATYLYSMIGNLVDEEEDDDICIRLQDIEEELEDIRVMREKLLDDETEFNWEIAGIYKFELTWEG